MSYRKRDIAHWNQGKSCKGTRKAKERAYVENEIFLQIAEQDESFRYRHYKRTPNREAQLQHRIEWYQQAIERHTPGPFSSYLRVELQRAKKALEKLQGK